MSLGRDQLSLISGKMSNGNLRHKPELLKGRFSLKCEWLPKRFILLGDNPP